MALLLLPALASCAALTAAGKSCHNRMRPLTSPAAKMVSLGSMAAHCGQGSKQQPAACKRQPAHVPCNMCRCLHVWPLRPPCWALALCGELATHPDATFRSDTIPTSLYWLGPQVCQCNYDYIKRSWAARPLTEALSARDLKVVSSSTHCAHLIPRHSDTTCSQVHTLCNQAANDIPSKPNTP